MEEGEGEGEGTVPVQVMGATVANTSPPHTSIGREKTAGVDITILVS